MAAGRADFDGWLAHGGASAASAKLVGKGLVFYAPLGDGSGNELAVSLAGELRQVSAGGPPAWDAGVTGAKAFKSRPDTSVAIKEAGDFEKDQPFTCSAWVKVPKDNIDGAIVARMDDGHGFQGWDLWLDHGRPGSHIVHKWPDDAVKVISQDRAQAGPVAIRQRGLRRQRLGQGGEDLSSTANGKRSTNRPTR